MRLRNHFIFGKLGSSVRAMPYCGNKNTREKILNRRAVVEEEEDDDDDEDEDKEESSFTADY